MPAVTMDTALPAELAARLDEEKRQAVSEAPRARRMVELAAALG